MDAGHKLEVDTLYHRSWPALFEHVGLAGAKLNPPEPDDDESRQ